MSHNKYDTQDAQEMPSYFDEIEQQVRIRPSHEHDGPKHVAIPISSTAIQEIFEDGYWDNLIDELMDDNPNNS